MIKNILPAKVVSASFSTDYLISIVPVRSSDPRFGLNLIQKMRIYVALSEHPRNLTNDTSSSTFKIAPVPTLKIRVTIDAILMLQRAMVQRGVSRYLSTKVTFHNSCPMVDFFHFSRKLEDTAGLIYAHFSTSDTEILFAKHIRGIMTVLRI